MKKDRRQINEIWEHTNPLGERFEYARVGSGKNSYIKVLRYLGENKKTKEDLKKQIRVYAQHYHSPISDIRGFNKVLKQNLGVKSSKKEVAKLLGYI